MKKIALLVTLSILSFIISKSQTPLYYVIRYYNNDSLNNDPIGYGQRKAEEIKKIILKLDKNDTTLYGAYCELGWCNGSQKDIRAKYFLKAIEVAKRTKKVQWLNRDASDIINVFQTAGLADKAISLCYEYLERANEIKDTSLIYISYVYLIDIYNERKEYNYQLKYSKDLLRILENYTNINTRRLEENKQGLIKNTYSNIGDAFMNLNKLDSALFYFQKSYQISISESDFSQMIPLVNLGEINSKLNQYEIAISYYRKALKISYENEPNKMRTKIGICNDISKSFFELHNLDSSLKYSHIAYNLAKLRSNLNGQIDATKILSDIYKFNNNIDSAYYFQNIYYSLKDSVFSDEKKQSITTKAAEEIAKENDRLESQRIAEEVRTKNLQLGLIAVFIPTFASAVYFISKKRKRNSKIITILGLASLLMLFEFISLLIHPHIEKLTHHNEMLMYIILLIIASILVPLHHKLEGFVKSKL